MEGITSPPMGQFSSGNIYSPLLISLLGILCTTFAILFYHFFLVRYCMNRHRDSQSSTTTSPPPQPPHTGIDQKILNSIPILPFLTVRKRNAHVANHEECVVCLGDLEDEDLTRVLPNCKHAFHVECIDVWLNANVTCPLCRSGITAEGKAPINDHVVLCSEEGTVTTTSFTNDEELNRGIDGSDHHATAQSCGLLRHCASLVLTPAGDRRSRSVAGLKRSLSMDQSFIAIDIQSEGESSSVNRDDGLCSAGGSASASVTRSEVTQSLNLNQLDRMSSRLLRSFSRLGIGKGNSATTLPY